MTIFRALAIIKVENVREALVWACSLKELMIPYLGIGRCTTDEHNQISVYLIIMIQ